jgi:hypothetical protein
LYIGAEWQYFHFLEDAYASFNKRYVTPEFTHFNSINQFVVAHSLASDAHKDHVIAIIIEERQRLFQVGEDESDQHNISGRFDVNTIDQADRGAELAGYVAKELAWENKKDFRL